MDLEASSPTPFHVCGIVYSNGHRKGLKSMEFISV